MTDLLKTSLNRRTVLQAATVGAVASARAARPCPCPGLGRARKKEVKIGFIPLTDCASVVMASVLGFDKKYGVTIVPTKEASWVGVRDKLVNGELDFAHVLYGLVYGVHLGTAAEEGHGGTDEPQQQRPGDHAVQGPGRQGRGGRPLAAALMEGKARYTFAGTFPTGTHAMWMHYWLAAAGINPLSGAKLITVPPPQMVANMRVGNMDGFCVGEPWNHRAIMDGIGITANTTQDIWKTTREGAGHNGMDFVKKYPNTTRAVMMAVLEASRWIDASLSTR